MKNYDVLLVNDDGFEAQGLVMLREELRKAGLSVFTFAPLCEKSASAHSLSVKRDLKLVKISDDIYALDGTPSDCVAVALGHFCRAKYILSGINRGANMSEDATYSGTLGACMEAALRGIPSLGLSQFMGKADFTRSARLSAKLLQHFIASPARLREREFISVNFPASELDFKGFKLCGMGRRHYRFKYLKKMHHDEIYFRFSESEYEFEAWPGSDLEAVHSGFASITPIHLNLASSDSLKTLAGIDDDINRQVF